MLRRLREKLEFTEGLGFRLGTLLSVAILPLGLISLMQTLHLSREVERASEIALLGRTSAAASGERAILQSALGAADALGPAVLETMADPNACSEMLRGFIERSATYVYAGMTRIDGTTTCNSRHVEQKLLDSPHYLSFMRNPSTLVTSTQRGAVTGQPVVIVSQPLYRDTELVGYIALSLSQDLLRSTHSMTEESKNARILTFNQHGQILSTDGSELGPALPRGKSLVSLLARSETTFREDSATGESRVFSVVPVIPGLVFALGSWSPQGTGFSTRLSNMTAVIYPLALWAVSLAVAYFAVYRLVIRHIRELRSQMRRFAIGTRDAPPPVLHDAPREIEDVSQTFHNMARILIRDEAALEDSVQEKTVLLKEVHHRVKNNLQLIASIINMQSRVIDDADAKRVLRSVQDRVGSLASIYKNLYQAEHLDAVEADRLIGDIVNQMVNASVAPGQGLRIETEIEPLTLLPDQAVPLSLLATEAFTNALKYAGAPPGDAGPSVRVSLTSPEPGLAVLEVRNSMGEGVEPVEGTGLGSQLIEAFAMQLEGEAEVGPVTGEKGDEFRLSLRFPVEGVPVLSDDDDRKVVLTSAARGGATH
ncbi:MAG: histidine kinase dimerization/phosphoacceptor domain -containing protein [Paracoccus sp. (in: a-proteobacteria)]|nr:histidine kinase dimerization/phosphoacceptor domain -containing protein [Paracoccus sp. (in: a-proteobacteria)]